jgi:hypothetical protein
MRDKRSVSLPRTLFAAALLAAAWSPALAAARPAHGDSPLTLPLVLIAIGVAVVVTAVAVLRLYRSAFGANRRPRDTDQT